MTKIFISKILILFKIVLKIFETNLKKVDLRIKILSSCVVGLPLFGKPEKVRKMSLNFDEI